MTWTVTHTIPFSTNADFHTAFVYLFDTFLPTKAGMTTGAHPDASAFKRKLKRTTTNMFGGGSYEEYFWVSWVSTTNPTTLVFYRDGTYTSAPGDLGTDATNVVTGSLPTGVAGSIRFWSSDQNPRAALVTKGKAVMYWEPGFPTLASYDRGGWTGTAATCIRSFVFPFIPQSPGIGLRCGPPNINTGTSTLEYYWGPSLGVTTPASGYYGITDRLDMNVPFVTFDSTSIGSPSTGAEPVCGGLGNDVGVWRPASPAGTDRYIATSSNGTGALVLASGRYYLIGRNTVSQISTAWDMGATEPDFS